MCDCELQWTGGLIDSEEKGALLMDWALRVCMFSSRKCKKTITPLDVSLSIHPKMMVVVNHLLTKQYCISTQLAWPDDAASPVIYAYFDNHYTYCALEKNQGNEKDGVSNFE